MNNDRRKALVEKVLGRCWHEYSLANSLYCLKCGEHYGERVGGQGNSPFDTEPDMMALYRAIHEKGLWGEFIDWIDATQDIPLEHNGEGHAWLICLSGEGYESRCEMVAEFFEGRGQ